MTSNSMLLPPAKKQKIKEEGFAVIPQVYTQQEVGQLSSLIQSADKAAATFRKSDDLFAIRQCIKEVPGLTDILFNRNLKNIVTQLFGDGYFITKSIYFDKPAQSNWFVAWHQDLTISVDKKHDTYGFGPWTVKQQQFAVQPPLPVLQNNFTIRIHLDTATTENGALKVIPRSHNKGIYRPEAIDWTTEREKICEVQAAGIMIMKPLLLHASGRTTNQRRRRVLHIEFGKDVLPPPLQWAEYYPF